MSSREKGWRILPHFVGKNKPRLEIHANYWFFSSMILIHLFFVIIGSLGVSLAYQHMIANTPVFDVPGYRTPTLGELKPGMNPISYKEFKNVVWSKNNKRICESEDPLHCLDEAIKYESRKDLRSIFYTLKGKHLLDIGEISGAIEALDEAISLDPTNFIASLFLSDAYKEFVVSFKNVREQINFIIETACGPFKENRYEPDDVEERLAEHKGWNGLVAYETARYYYTRAKYYYTRELTMRRQHTLNGPSISTLLSSSILAEKPSLVKAGDNIMAMPRDYKNCSLRFLGIGIDLYEKDDSEFNSLAFAVSDTEKIAKSLNRYGFKSNLAINQKATTLNILKLLGYESLISAPGDKLILYIAAHGFVDITGKPFIVTYTEDKAENAFLSLPAIASMLGMHKGEVLIILDTCFEQFSIDLTDYPDLNIYTTNSNAKLTFLLASSLGEKSIESPKLGTSLVTHALLEYLDKLPAQFCEFRTAKGDAIQLEAMSKYIVKITSDSAKSMYGLEQIPHILSMHDRQAIDNIGRFMRAEQQDEVLSMTCN